MKDLFADYSGVPDENSGPAITANNDAIAAALADAVAGTGDGFYFDRPFYFSEPFTFPVEADEPNRPLHFGIQGRSPSAWMMYTGDRANVAIDVSGAPFHENVPGLVEK